MVAIIDIFKKSTQLHKTAQSIKEIPTKYFFIIGIESKMLSINNMLIKCVLKKKNKGKKVLYILIKLFIF